MGTKLRIAVWYNLPSGGAKRALTDHLKGLLARGHTLEAWRPPVLQEEYLPISELVSEHVVSPGGPLEEGRGYAGKIARHIARPFLLRDGMRRHSESAAREMRDGGFDVLFANTCMRYHAPWIGRYFEAPRLLYLQEPHRPFYECFPELPWPALPDEVRTSWRPGALKRRVRDALDVRGFRLQAADELRNARSYDRLLCNSVFSRESLLRAYGLDSTVCPLGIDAAHFRDLSLPREPFVLSVGTFGPSKDPEFVVRAVGTIREGRPRLVWVANMTDPVHLAGVQALARELGVELDVRRYVPEAELLDLLNRAAVFAYAPRLEPFGYAPLEANACGCPAVVTAEGGVKETIEDGVNGIVVPHRPEAMGAAIADLLARPERARALGERASAHVRERWTLERATDALERNLLEVAGRA